MTPLIGTPKQIAWAETIRADMLKEFNNCMSVLMHQNKLPAQFFEWALIIEKAAKQNSDAGDWIRFKGKFYSVAARTGLLHDLRNKLDWSHEEEKAIGYGVFDRLKEIAI